MSSVHDACSLMVDFLVTITSDGQIETGVYRGHSGAVVTHSPVTSLVGGSNPGPYVGKLVFTYRWLAVYITEP